MDKYSKAISNTTKRYVSRAEPKTASNPEEEGEPVKVSNPGKKSVKQSLSGQS
ncbi:hypothetical protein ES703_121857 [subsurface metagenome]